jgi:hypothetical protein
MGVKAILERALKVFGLCKSITLFHKWITFHPMGFKAPFEGGLRFMQVHHFCFTNEWPLTLNSMGFKIILYTGSRVLGLCKSFFCFMKV